MPYEFELWVNALQSRISYNFTFSYRKLSLQFYSILLQRADDVQAVSVDEALIDVTTAVRELSLGHCPSSISESCDHDLAKVLAESLRTQIREATGCEGRQTMLYVCSVLPTAFSQHWDRAQHPSRASRNSAR